MDYARQHEPDTSRTVLLTLAIACGFVVGFGILCLQAFTSSFSEEPFLQGYLGFALQLAAGLLIFASGWLCSCVGDE